MFKTLEDDQTYFRVDFGANLEFFYTRISILLTCLLYSNCNEGYKLLVILVVSKNYLHEKDEILYDW